MNDQEILAQVLVDNGYPVIKTNDTRSIKGSNSFAVIEKGGKYQLSKPVQDYMQDPKIRALFNKAQLDMAMSWKAKGETSQGVGGSFYYEGVGNDGKPKIMQSSFNAKYFPEQYESGALMREIEERGISIAGFNADASGKFQEGLAADADYVARHNAASATTSASSTASSSTGVKKQSFSTTQASDFAKMNGQQLFMAIHKGEITPSKDNPIWNSLYQNGQATSAMQEAYSKWDNYMKSNPSYVPPKVQQQTSSSTTSGSNQQSSTPAPQNQTATQGGSSNFSTMNGQQLFMAIYNGEITPSKENPLWSSLYQNGQPTPAMQEAYAKWSNYMANNPNYVPPVARQQTSSGQSNNSGTGQGQQNTDVDTSGVSGGAGALTDPDAARRLQEALDAIDADPNLPPELKSLYKQAVREWPADKVVDVQNILSEFNRIKTETIDPYYKSVVDFATDQISKSAAFQAAERNTQLEQERAAAGTTIRQAKAGLESAGMTFTGKGITTLGAESAYAQEPGQSAIPTQTPFGGLFYEGEIPQANRIMATSNALNYQKNIQALGAEAESRLGSGGAALLNLPGYGVTGGQMGSIEQNRQQQMGTTLSGLINQETANQNQANPLAYQPNLVSV